MGLLVLCLLGLMGCKHATPQPDVAVQPIDTIPMMVFQIQQCSRLYTAEYKVRKIVSHDDEKAIQGKLLGKDFSLSLPFGKRVVAIPIDATIKAYIDFSDFTAANVARHGNHIEITLPDPEVVMTSTRIDHDAIKQHVPLLRSNFTDAELTSIQRQGRQAIIKTIPQMGIVETARTNAATLLIPIIEQMGFSRDNIVISFRKDYAPTDILKRLTFSNVEHATQQ